MSEVPATVTPIDRHDAAALLVKHWGDVDRETAAMLLALMWIETGGGRATQHNVGNLTASETYSTLWRPPWYPEPKADTPEKLKRLHKLMLEGKAPKAFRAYPNWDAGMDDFVGLLKVHYEPLLEAAATGDVPTFRAELARKYSADYTPKHDPNLTRLRDSFREHVSQQPAPKTAISPRVPGKASPGGGGSGGGGLVAMAALLALKGLV